MITRGQNEQGLSYIDINTDLCTARVWVHGAHITSWKPTGATEDVFFVSPCSKFEPNVAIRGGIPLCWPWFGKKSGAPSHGIARISSWDVDTCTEKDGVVELVFSLHPSDTDLPEARLSARFGTELLMTLTTKDRTAPCHLSLAFHNYFQVADIKQVSVEGLQDAHFVDCVPVPATSDSSVLTFDRAIDRIYSMPTPEGIITLSDPVAKRDIIIKREQSSSVVVWNPWEEASKAMSDMTDDGWGHFLCVETADVAENSITLEPGQAMTLTQSIQVRPHN